MQELHSFLAFSFKNIGITNSVKELNRNRMESQGCTLVAKTQALFQTEQKQAGHQYRFSQHETINI